MRTRRSGISNLVGTVFFILIVGLVVSTLLIIFDTNSGFVSGLHSSASIGIGNSESLVEVQNLTFGGYYSTASSQLAMTPSSPTPLLPIPNMNITGSDEGWYVSKSYSVLADDVSITNSNTSSAQLPSVESFTLTVQNADPAGSGTAITKVTLILDTNFSEISGSPAGGPWTVGRYGNDENITWYLPNADLSSGLTPGTSKPFVWSAYIPARLGVFYETVVLTWNRENAPYAYIDTGVATFQTPTKIVGVKFYLEKGIYTASTTGVTSPSGFPGSISAGYDGSDTSSTSGSGPGSLYVDYQPSLNSAVAPPGMQTTATVSFTAPFSLQSDIKVPGCCAVSWESSLDALTASRNPLIVYNVELKNATWSALVNTNGTNPDLVNYFGPTGWQQKTVHLSESLLNTATLEAGSYELVISANMTVPGGATSGVLMHFDDIGLSALPSGDGVVYGSQEMVIPVGVPQSEVQELQVGVNVTGGTVGAGIPEYKNASVYVFASDDASGTLASPRWQELGAATFNTSAEVQATVSLPEAALYVTPAGLLDLNVTVISPNSLGCSPNPFTSSCSPLFVSVYTVVSNDSQSRGVVFIAGLKGSTPVHLASLYISGASGLTTATLTSYLPSGGMVIVPLTNFDWVTGQVYTVTVTTTSGLTFSRSFTAPTA